MKRISYWLLCAVEFACGQAAPPPQAPPQRPPVIAAGETAPPRSPPPSWIEDDFARALAEAKAKKLPLFVDASAAWCHTCKAMRAFVLEDETVPRAGFVWASFDIEKPENAEAAKKLPAPVLPTFFVLDPADESVHGRWEGAGSVQQMRGFLDDARRSIELAHAGSLPPGDPLALLLAGHRAVMQQDLDAAEKSFEAAVAKAPPGWPRLPDALLALIVARKRLSKTDACLALAAEVLPTEKLGRSSVLSDFADAALACAKKGPPERATPVRKLAQETLFRVATDERAPMSPDDRGDALLMVWQARDELGDHAGALEAAKTRLAILEQAAERAPTPQIAEAFDGARMETLEYLGRPADAIPFLKEHDEKLEGEYNPARRLAHVYSALGKWPEALDAVTRAISRSWGATRAQMLGRKADILLKLDRKADAKAAVREQVKLYKELPEGQKKPALEKSAEERLAKM